MAIVIELATHPELGTQSPLRDPQYAEAQKTYNSHQYFVAEGVVHVLHTQNVNGHEKGDIIKIGDVEFVINYYGGLEFGYEQTISHGGALTEGTYARVFYIENGYWPDYTSLGRYTILRVDVKRK